MTHEVDPTARGAWLDEVAPVLEEHTELRVTGQPDGGYPPYDFTFRSDRTDAGSLEGALGVLRHVSRWSGVRLQRRHVRVERRETDWEDLEVGGTDGTPSGEAVTGGS